MKLSRQILLIGLLLTGCAQSLPKVRDITELFPPKNARIYAENQAFRLVWDASIDQDHPDFMGYNIYYGPKSLVLASVEDLPTPIFVAKPQNDFLFTNLDSTEEYYIHIRSANKKGDISLPSLPELVINQSATF